MKQVFAFIFAFLAVNISHGQASRDEASEGRIDVMGEAELKLSPDYVSIYIMVEKEDTEPGPAQQAVMDEVRQVLEFLKKRRNLENLKTQHVELRSRVRDYQKGDKTYHTQQIISFDLMDVRDYDEVILRLLEQGIDGIHNVRFKSSQEEQHRQTLLQQAVMNARDKAQMLAGQLGQDVGHAVFISDRISRGSEPVRAEMFKSGVRVDSSVEPGEITLSATVNVQFQLK